MTGPPARVTDADLAQLLLIRRFEEALLDLFGRGEIAGTTHTCIGQEYVPVALAPLLRGDVVVSNHRGHGHYLAHCDDPAGLLAEVMGRDGAVGHGVGGSQHLHRDGFLSTGVQGEGLPVAVGIAMHLRRRGDRIAVCYMGDGTWGEGAVYEALNMAALWGVPVLAVVEHNGIAQSTPTASAMAGTIGGRAAAFGIAFDRIETTDVDAIRTRVAPIIDRVRAGAPHVVQFDTVRVGPHSKGDDSRSPEEIARVRRLDWCARYAAVHPEQFVDVDTVQRRRVADLVDATRAAAPSAWNPE